MKTSYEFPSVELLDERVDMKSNRPVVPIKTVLSSNEFAEAKEKFELPVAIGQTTDSKVKTFDITAAPHILKAGATMQGKTKALHAMITSLLYSKRPCELKFAFIDPKKVELSAYSRLTDHYLAMLPGKPDIPIAHEQNEAEDVLKALCVEMEKRNQLFEQASVNNIKQYNEKFRAGALTPEFGFCYLPYIVVVIDEYADLILGGNGTMSRKVSDNIMSLIVRLAQGGRRVGIHLVITTQRPSTDVITGVIKTNFPTRMAFRTIQRIDSMTILDEPDAENLCGSGDMLFRCGIESERVQCAYVDDSETARIIDNILGQKKEEPYFLPQPEK